MAHAASGFGVCECGVPTPFGHQFDRFHETPASHRGEHSAGKASNRGRYLRAPTPTERQFRPISEYEGGLSDQGGSDFACMREIDEHRPMNANKL